MDSSVAIELHEANSVTITSLGAVVGHPQHDESMIRASVQMNVILLVGKAAAAVMSSSPAILASLVDSSVDVLVQAALFWASQAARRGATSALYPVGRGQLEPVAVVVCAALKCAGMVAVFSRSIDLLLEADQDLTKNGCLHPHDVHKHGLKHIWHDHWQSVALLALVSARACLRALKFCVPLAPSHPHSPWVMPGRVVCVSSYAGISWARS